MVRLLLRGLVNLLAAGILAAGISPAAGHEIEFKHLRIQHPYAIEPVERLPRELPIYMVIGNSSDTLDRLVGVEFEPGRLGGPRYPVALSGRVAASNCNRAAGQFANCRGPQLGPRHAP